MSKPLIFLTLVVVLISGVLYFKPSFAQTASCTTGTFAEGLVSGGGGLDNAGNTSGACATGDKVTYSDQALPSYQTMKKKYYERAKNTTLIKVNQPQSGPKTQSDIDSSDDSSKSVLYNITGNLTIASEFIIKTNTKIIFVDGDLYLNPPLTEFVYDNPQAGVIFIVQGSIYIDENIERLDGIFISSGKGGTPLTDKPFTICTAYDTGGCTSPVITDASTINKQLVVNGSFISLNPAVKINFYRNPRDKSKAAEIINQQPKYLILLKDVLSDTLDIRTEL